ncbi:MAG: hypothetical protein K2N43_09165 [Lachnospiraceae bacterium]|nr:hypothetical protein [Lachnospiraceae bacterium]
MKKKLGSILTIMIMVLACAHSDEKKVEEIVESASDVTIEFAEPEEFDVKSDDAVDTTIAPDLNHNGIAEHVRVAKTNEGRHLMIWEDDEWLCRVDAYFTEENQTSIFLCTLDGEDYLLRYHPTMYQGMCTYEYELSAFEGNEERTVGHNKVNFDINFGSLLHEDFDPEAIAVFMHEINELFSHSVQLLNTDKNLLATFEKEGCLYDSLWWLDEWEPEYSRDGNKSLLKNLKNFQATMTSVQKPTNSEEMDGLPITEPLEMRFSSGAGAWATVLTLNPDGSFVGDYLDTDIGNDYPEKYVCQFHGRFGKVEKLTEASWVLIMEELELDTGHKVGEEWDVTDEYGTVHYISSEPYGFDDEDWRALEPGARFILYGPDATGHEPGTELYGAVEFQSWVYKEFNNDTDILGCWGLQNMETGYGFFSGQVKENPE